MSVITRAILAAAPAIATGFAALLATPASAQLPINYYIAVPAAAPASTRLITNGTAWRWENAAFVSSKAPQRDVILCAAVAKRVGPLASFSVAGKAYDADALAACNNHAK
ncbi:CC_3452 family protein [Sphingomonas faeni]|uniref:CC_3452 family protein n=1 Tax=Sphingomonas faeni TaxID=185950 RepID=UPI003346415D